MAAKNVGILFVFFLASGRAPSISLLLVDYVDERLAGGKALDVLARGPDHPRVVLIRTACHMRSDDRVFEFSERVAFRQRLRIRHIHARAGKTLGVERLHQASRPYSPPRLTAMKYAPCFISSNCVVCLSCGGFVRCAARRRTPRTPAGALRPTDRVSRTS
jgi:hypothetical protein